MKRGAVAKRRWNAAVAGGMQLLPEEFAPGHEAFVDACCTHKVGWCGAGLQLHFTKGVITRHLSVGKHMVHGDIGRGWLESGVMRKGR